MRILCIHNRYRQTGGEDAVFEAEVDLLLRHGHDVEALLFDNQEVADGRSLLGDAKLAFNTIWSRASAARIRDVISQHRPQVAHFHNTFPLISPAGYQACRDAGVPVVQTLHNYRLLCPSATFYRANGSCEDCLGKFIPWPGILHGCYRGSRLQTGATAAMLTAHRTMRTWHRNVDVFVALTEFGRQKFIEGGLDSGRIVVKPQFVIDPGTRARLDEGRFLLYVGRLSTEKGIKLLIELWGENCPNIELRIIGDGPFADAVQCLAKNNQSVRYLGKLSKDNVLAQMQSAFALVFPSVCYEGFAMTIVEAFASGLPVIAPRHGSTAEIVEHKHTGLLFSPGKKDDLAEQIQWALLNDAEWKLFGLYARRRFEERFTEATAYRNLLSIYQRAIAVSPPAPL